MKKHIAVVTVLGGILLAAIVVGDVAHVQPSASPDARRELPQCTEDRICYVGQDWIRYREYQCPQGWEWYGALQSVTTGDMEEIRAFVDDYQALIAGMEDSADAQRQALYENYGFDPDCLSNDDWFSLEKAWDGGKPGRSGLWLLDSGSLTLYGMEVKY